MLGNEVNRWERNCLERSELKLWHSRLSEGETSEFPTKTERKILRIARLMLSIFLGVLATKKHLILKQTKSLREGKRVKNFKTITSEKGNTFQATL